MPTVEILRDAARASILLHPERLRLLESLSTPDSAAGVARRMKIPRQLVNYHLHALEKAGLVEFVQERRKGNCIEKLLRATAESYLISPKLLGTLVPSTANQDRFSAGTLVATAAQAITDLGELQVRGKEPGKRLPTLSLATEIRFANAASRTAFAEEFTAAFLQLAAKYNQSEAPGGRLFRVFAGGYPAVTRAANSGSETARFTD